MRIYIKEPGRFAKYKGKIVLTQFQDTDNTIIRDQYGDVLRVKNDKLHGLTIEELSEELKNDDSLREIAAIEEYITVGDYNNDDLNYINYAASYS